MSRHHVSIRLRHVASAAPWKWVGTCDCGWRCISWHWRLGDRGAMPLSLEHLREQAR